MAQYHSAPAMWIPASTASGVQPPAVAGMMHAPPTQLTPAPAPQFQYPVYARGPAPVSQPVAHPGGPIYYQQHPPGTVPQPVPQPYQPPQMGMRPPMQPVPQPVLHPGQQPTMQPVAQPTMQPAVPQPAIQPGFQPGVQSPIQPSTIPMAAVGQAPVGQPPMQAIQAPIQGAPAPGMQSSTYYMGSNLVQSSAVIPMPAVNGSPGQVVQHGSPTPVRYGPVPVPAYQPVVSNVSSPYMNASVTATPGIIEQATPGPAGSLVHLELPVPATPDNSSVTVSTTEEVATEVITTSSSSDVVRSPVVDSSPAQPSQVSIPDMVDSGAAQPSQVTSPDMVDSSAAQPSQQATTPPTAVVQPMAATSSTGTLPKATTPEFVPRALMSTPPSTSSSSPPILQPPMPTTTNPLRMASKARIEKYMDSSGIMNDTWSDIISIGLRIGMRWQY